MRTRRWIAGTGAGTLLLAGVVTGGPLVSASFQDASPAAEVADDDVANATPVVGTPLLAPAIDLTKAQEAALVGQDGAKVTSITLDGSDGTLVYDVELDNGVEVEVDATTGELGQVEQAGGGEADGGDAETGDNGTDGEANDDGDQGDGDGETNDDQGDQGDQGENEDA